MITAMIVDDEPIIRKGILTAIDWENIGINWIDEAINGKDALAKALSYKPDIVVTDIKMPIMDGIELSKELRESLPNTKIVFLTGYDDFDYLRHAVKIKATDYLLKPTNLDNLVKIMVSLKEEVEKDKVKRNKKKLRNQLVNENLTSLRFNLLYRFMINELTTSEFLKKSKSIGIEFNEPSYQVVSFSIDNYYKLIDKGEKEIKLLKYATGNITEEVFASICNCFLCDEGEDSLVLLISGPAPINKVIESCNEIQYKIQNYYDLTITFGIGKEVNELEELKVSYDQSKKALENKMLKGNNRIILFDETHNNSIDNTKVFLDKQDEVELKEYLQLLNNKKDQMVLYRLFDKYIHNQNLDQKTIEQLSMNIISIAVKELQENQISPLVVLGHDYYYHDEIKKYDTVKNIEKWIKEIYKKTIAAIEDRQNNKYKNVVIKGMNYAKEFYDRNLLVSEVAEAVFVTPNYFSKVFKSETGENFSEWLNKYRVEEAKKIIGEKPELKAYEVAEKVGFQDYKYFSYIFKKYTGMTSQVYKQKYGKN